MLVGGREEEEAEECFSRGDWRGKHRDSGREGERRERGRTGDGFKLMCDERSITA